jgi:hypothetical protein
MAEALVAGGLQLNLLALFDQPNMAVSVKVCTYCSYFFPRLQKIFD